MFMIFHNSTAFFNLINAACVHKRLLLKTLRNIFERLIGFMDREKQKNLQGQ